MSKWEENLKFWDTLQAYTNGNAKELSDDVPTSIEWFDTLKKGKKVRFTIFPGKLRERKAW